MFGPYGTATWEILILPIFPLSAFPDATSRPVSVLQPWALAASSPGKMKAVSQMPFQRPNQLAEVISWPLSQHYHINTGTPSGEAERFL